MLLTRNYLNGLQLVSVKRKMQMLQKVFAMINATQQLHNKYEQRREKESINKLIMLMNAFLTNLCRFFKYAN